MTRDGSKRVASLAVLCLLMPPLVDRTLACAVCFGDPESAMARGAVMGVTVMVGVVGFVLSAMVGTTMYWVHRSRHLVLPEGPGDGRNA